MDPEHEFGLSCPFGGVLHLFFQYDYSFIGCCGVDPCTGALSGQCPDDELHPLSFVASKGGDLVQQSCQEPYDENSWLLQKQSVQRGMCTGKPDLGESQRQSRNASQFVTGWPYPSPIPGTSTTQTQTKTPTSSPTETAEADGGSTSRTGLIVGITMAGVIILLAVLGAYLWWKRKENARLEQGYARPPENRQPEVAEEPQVLFRDAVGTPVPVPVATTLRITNPDDPNNLAVASNRLKSESGSWAPRDVHSRHTSMLSELSGNDFMPMQERPAAANFKHISELEGSAVSKPAREGLSDMHRSHGTNS
ncbi:Uu.00g101190.m01.CDS01 [Anthostomella pinea]|uniref:Uu.00g101190.m01.CDS01 n=1 Tax=Anthostomella pinea TaxID=933095 RepID=A0AAI8YCZ7_9PEZI|nr:Uu.00g101190.m01.CDS01 [Anthostomella pinea]